MKKLVLMSILFATLWIPLAMAAKNHDVRVGVRKVQKQFLVFFALYVVTVLYVLPRI